MTIRRLMFLLALAFALLSAGAGLWQLADSRQKVQAVDWIQRANHLADVAQRASARLAMERGITAAILASPGEATPGMRAEMARVRASVDGYHRRLSELTGELEKSVPAHPVFAKLGELRASRVEMERSRQRVDALLGGEDDGLAAEEWIALMTRRIEGLQNLAAISMLPLQGNVYTNVSLPVIKDVLFTLSEHVGRERAMVGVAIARGAPLTAAEERVLADYRVIAVRAIQRVESIVRHLPDNTDLARARQVFERDFLRDYESLRERVYASSREGHPYPVDAEQWYRQATDGIDAVLGLSVAVSDLFERNIGGLRQHAVSTQALLAMLVTFLGGLFAISVQAFRRRVLQPLNVLERAAATISAGDLSQALPPQRNDEFGQLGRAFEHMRRTLLEDIRQREAYTEELRKFSALIEHSASAMIVTDVDGKVEYANSRFQEVTGYSPREALGSKAGFWRSGLTSTAQYCEMWDTVLQGKVWEGELINRRKNGELYWASVSVSPVFDGEGLITHFIGVQHDISERRRIEERLNFLSSYDELTHLPNRSLLARRFELACAEAVEDGTMIGIVSLGISRFKRINDSLGRDVGDQLLKEIAQRLSHCARPCDTVSRHAGTEFTMMLTRLSDLEEAGQLLERIIETVNLPTIIKGEKLQPSVSAGLSLVPHDGDALDTLLRKAGVALHHAESQGLSHCVYTMAFDRDAQERLSLENALRLSIERNTLELHYQPKVDLVTGRVIGAEALARWLHPVANEYVSPQRFIPIAEESGLIGYLGAWALREACRQGRAWQEDGLAPIVIAVNLSAVQLRQPDIVDLIAEVLRETGLAPDLLELELTESALMDNPDQANLILNRLKALGVRVAIDDFGTGYSSLAYLSQFPVDQLKIDSSFIRQVPGEPTAAAISTSVIALAHQMGLKVIAEGVETAEQLSFLIRHGCDEMQGYHFSRPVPPDDFAVLLRSGRRLVLPGPGESTRTLLVVDNEREVVASIVRALEDDEYRILTAESGREALELLASNDVQVILSDERMPDMSGAKLFAQVRKLYPETVRIVLSGYAQAESIIEAVNTGAIYKFMTKPWDEAHLRGQILDAFRNQESLSAARGKPRSLTRT